MSNKTTTFEHFQPNHFVQQFYKKNPWKFIGAIILSIVTLGLFPLICYFRKAIWIDICYDRCDPSECSAVIFEELVSKRRHAFFVERFSADSSASMHLTEHKRSLEASQWLWLRINVGDHWYVQYDIDFRQFVPLRRIIPDLPNAHETSWYRKDVDQLASVLNKGKDDEHELVGFEKVKWRCFLLYLQWILTAGIFWLFCYWQPFLKLHLTHRRCNLLTADSILIMTPPVSLIFSTCHAIFINSFPFQ